RLLFWTPGWIIKTHHASLTQRGRSFQPQQGRPKGGRGICEDLPETPFCEDSARVRYSQG
ncbi:hypothetical protein C8R47DRAFT_1315736, partial [Mycena vitilis]